MEGETFHAAAARLTASARAARVKLAKPSRRGSPPNLGSAASMIRSSSVVLPLPAAPISRAICTIPLSLFWPSRISGTNRKVRVHPKDGQSDCPFADTSGKPPLVEKFSRKFSRHVSLQKLRHETHFAEKTDRRRTTFWAHEKSPYTWNFIRRPVQASQFPLAPRTPSETTPRTICGHRRGGGTQSAGNPSRPPGGPGDAS